MTGHGGHAHGASHVTHGPRWLTIGIAAVLGIAAVFAGVTTWRAQVMQGHAVEEFTLSTQATNSANSLMQNAERGMSGERQLFLDYQNALAAGNATIATQSLAMMSANSRAAIAWWRAQPTDTRPYSPFVSANPAWNAPGAVIDAPDVVAARAVRMVLDQQVVAADGSVMALRVDTICVHGDTPGAAQLAAAIGRALTSAGVTVTSLVR